MLLGGKPADDLIASEAAVQAQTDVVWRAANTELARLLQVRTDGFNSRLRMNLGLVAAALLVSMFVLYGVARSITAPLNKLTGCMRALAGGNNDAEVPGENRTDEIGEMARNVAVFFTKMRSTAKGWKRKPRRSRRR